MTAEQKAELLKALDTVRNAPFVLSELENANYHSVADFLGEVHDDLAQRPVEPVTLTLYAHKNTDEDNGEDVIEAVQAGLPEEVAQDFYDSNPLYEVEFTFQVDPLTGKSECIKADLGDAVLTRVWS
jgi:hypothetical protein